MLTDHHSFGVVASPSNHGCIGLGAQGELGQQVITASQTETMLIAIDEQGIIRIIPLAQVETIAGLNAPLLFTIACQQQRIEGITLRADQIAGPGEVGVVNITLQEPGPGGIPSGSEVQSVFVLDTAAFAKTAGMQGCIALVVITVYGGEFPGVSGAETDGMDSCQGAVTIQGCLARNAPKRVGVTIVQTGIEEIVALSIILSI